MARLCGLFLCGLLFCRLPCRLLLSGLLLCRLFLRRLLLCRLFRLLLRGFLFRLGRLFLAGRWLRRRLLLCQRTEGQ